MAWKIIKMTSTAVAPWKAYHGRTLGLKKELLPRITSAMIAKIQAAEMSQTNKAPMSHNMVRSLLVSHIRCPICSLRQEDNTGPLRRHRQNDESWDHNKDRAQRGLLGNSSHDTYVILTRRI